MQDDWIWTSYLQSWLCNCNCQYCSGIILQLILAYQKAVHHPGFLKPLGQRVSGTRGPSQIRTDRTDPADGPNGSIKIGDLQILTDPLGPLAGFVSSIRIWLGPRVPDTPGQPLLCNIAPFSKTWWGKKSGKIGLNIATHDCLICLHLVTGLSLFAVFSNFTALNRLRGRVSVTWDITW